MPEREQRGARLVPVAPAPLRVHARSCGCRSSGPGRRCAAAERQFSAGETSPKSRSATAAPPWVPGYQMPRIAGDVLGGPPQVERAAVHHQQHGRRAGGDHRLKQFQLPAGQLDRGPRCPLTDHVLPLADDDDRGVGGGDFHRTRTRHPHQTLGICRPVPAELVEHGRKDALHHANAGGVAIPHIVPDLCGGSPSSTVMVSSRSKSNTQGPSVSRWEAARARSVHRDGAELVDGEREQAPLLRNSTADRSAATRATSRCPDRREPPGRGPRRRTGRRKTQSQFHFEDPALSHR